METWAGCFVETVTGGSAEKSERKIHSGFCMEVWSVLEKKNALCCFCLTVDFLRKYWTSKGCV